LSPSYRKICFGCKKYFVSKRNTHFSAFKQHRQNVGGSLELAMVIETRLILRHLKQRLAALYETLAPEPILSSDEAVTGILK
jgi:hypothetical protein